MPLLSHATTPVSLGRPAETLFAEPRPHPISPQPGGRLVGLQGDSPLQTSRGRQSAVLRPISTKFFVGLPGGKLQFSQHQLSRGEARKPPNSGDFHPGWTGLGALRGIGPHGLIPDPRDA